jgi:hypothetical protein
MKKMKMDKNFGKRPKGFWKICFCVIKLWIKILYLQDYYLLVF